MEQPVAWSQLALWAIPTALMVGLALVAMSAVAARKCTHCGSDLETVAEEVHLSSWHTSITYTYVCPRCGQTSHGVYLPLVPD